MSERGPGFLEKMFSGWKAPDDKKNKPEHSSSAASSGAEVHTEGAAKQRAIEAERAKKQTEAPKEKQEDKLQYSSFNGEPLNAAARAERAKTQPEENKPVQASVSHNHNNQEPNIKHRGGDLGTDFVVSETNPNIPIQEKGVVKYGQGGDVVKYAPGINSPDGPKRTQDREFKKIEKVVIADITSIVDRYARDLARAKINEQINKSGALKRSWYRLTESGYEKKFFEESKAEILKNKNLLADIEVRLGRKSEGKQAFTGDQDKHYEILDKAIEAYMEEIVDSKEVSREAHQDAAIDAAAAGLIVDLYTGRISSRSQFEEEVEARVVNKYLGSELKTGKDRMYASSLWNLAQDYSQRCKDMVAEGRKEFGPENAEQLRAYLERTLKLDIKLGTKQADLYQKRPEDVMKWYEKVVDFTQMPFFKNSKLGRAAGKVLANPVAWAAAGGAGAKWATRAAGAAVGAAAFGGATAMLIGAGIGAGAYLGFRAIRERRRDIQRRETEAVLGLQGKETHEVKDARELIKQIEELDRKDGELDEQEKRMVAGIQARLDIQSRYGVDLIGVGKAEGQSYKTKFLAETDLRLALKKFMDDKKDAHGVAIPGTGRWNNFGNTQEQAFAQHRKMEGDQEIVIAAEIEKVNKEVAKELRNRGIKVAVIGGAISMAAGAVAPYAYEKLKVGSDYVFGTHWASHKTQYIEEAWHRIHDKFTGTHSGPSHDEIITVPGGGRGRTSAEWLQHAKDHTGHSSVEKIHTRNWYDNPTGETPHLHNANELKFFISKDHSGNLHFKVPIEGDGSWLSEHGHMTQADLSKAFADGRIKMIFVPDGHSPHDALVLNIDSATGEVIDPPAGFLHQMYDASGHNFKGYEFGLAEQMPGVRPDGSHDYIWINSQKGSNNMLFGNTDSTRIISAAKPGEFQNPWTVAGYRREKNQDAEANRKNRVGDSNTSKEGGIHKTVESSGGQRIEGDPLHTNTVEAPKEALEKAFDAIKEKLDKNELSEPEFLKAAEAAKVKPEDLLLKCLEYKNIDSKKELEKYKQIIERIPSAKNDVLWIALANSMAEQKAKQPEGGKAVEPVIVETGSDDGDDVTEDEKKKASSAFKKANGKARQSATRPALKGKDQLPPKNNNPRGRENPPTAPDNRKKPGKPNPREKSQQQERQTYSQAEIKAVYKYLKGTKFDSNLKANDREKNDAMRKLFIALGLLKESMQASKEKLPKGEWSFVFVNSGEHPKGTNAAGGKGALTSFEIPVNMGPRNMANFLQRQLKRELERQDREQKTAAAKKKRPENPQVKKTPEKKKKPSRKKAKS